MFGRVVIYGVGLIGGSACGAVRSLSKLCAWRGKDLAWLQQAVSHGVVDVEAMRVRAPHLVHPGAPGRAEIERRLLVLSRPWVAGD